MVMKKLWTRSELNILKKRYTEKGASYVAKKTGHPIHSVVAKANSLGIHSGALRRWSQFELNYILKNYSNKPSDSIARSLKRTVASVDNKARQLDIYVPKPKKWSPQQIEMLKQLWPDKKYSIDDVAAKLNKTRPATHYQAWKMGLRRPQVWKFWTKEEVKYLKKNYKKKTYVQIAKELDRSLDAIINRAGPLGISRKKK